VHYRIYNLDYGSDHKPIEIEVDFRSVIEPLARGKRLYKNADWERIKRRILDKIGDSSVLSRIIEPELLDFVVSSFTDQVEAVLEEEVPRAKASLYTKR
jgi:hypothetical protein